MATLIGRDFGSYRILEQIGQGGMAKVFKAYQPAMNRVVALKLLPDLYAQDENARVRFRQEARIIASLEHPHILPVHDFGETEENAFLVMRYLQAGNLKNLLAVAPENRLSLQDASLILSQIASALDYAHQKGIVHRDVKPANILIDRHGRAFLTDFGVAKVLEATQELTRTGSTLGTPAYMSPEQAAGKEVDGRSDVYSLGIVLYQMLVGRPPFDADTPYATLIAHINESLPLPSSINQKLPENVELVLIKALAKDPEERFQSAGEITNAIQEALGGSASRADLSPQILQLIENLSEERPREDLTHDDLRLLKEITREKRKKIMIPWLISALFLLILIGAGAVTLWMKIQSDADLANAAVDPTRIAQGIAFLTETSEAFKLQETDSEFSQTPEPPVTLISTASALPSDTLIATAQTQALTDDNDDWSGDLSVRKPTLDLEVGSTQISLMDEVPMIYIPEGSFKMGGDIDQIMRECYKVYLRGCDRKWYENEAPVHTVILDGFYIDKYEVTNANYEMCVKDGMCLMPMQIDSFTRDEYYWDEQYGDYPVIYVGWQDAKIYCEWRGARLPTEAEWEKAARGGLEEMLYPWGNTFDGNQANFCDSNCDNYWVDQDQIIKNDGFEDTAPVGSYSPNSFGIHDMAGNVWEWVSDWYYIEYFDQSPSENPQGSSTGDQRIFRGGSFTDDRLLSMVSFRFPLFPGYNAFNLGFRCAASE